MTQTTGPADPPPEPQEAPEPEAVEVAASDRRPMLPEDGFGQRWEKRYRIRLDGSEVPPETVMATWKARFSEFWPEGNRFSRSLTEAKPGDLAVSDLELPAGGRVFAGVIVQSLSPTSFTFVTTRGHPFAATITFTTGLDNQVSVAGVTVDMRASDPLYEVGLMLGGHKREDRFWNDTLKALAEAFGVTAEPVQTVVRTDRRRKWKHATNITHNDFIRSMLTLAKRPVRILTGRFPKRSSTPS